jgi:predicted AAA+ superfamily ATPase
MTAFHTIAVPHEDILAGRLTMDVFAADLWKVHKDRAPDEYRDAVRFFQKTYQTEGRATCWTWRGGSKRTE